MKTTSEYIALLRKYMAENAHKYGIVRMGIFGSVARGEQTEIVMWMCVWRSAAWLFRFSGYKARVEELLGCKVDIVRLRDRMDSFLRERIQREGIYV